MTTTMVSTDDIKRLREETGAGIMDAKKALQDAGGDLEKAKKLLEQRGAASAARRGAHAAVNGIVEPYIHAGGQIGVLVELDCETDFVARLDDFKNLAHELALQIAATDPKYISLDEFPAGEAEDLKQRFRQEAEEQGKAAKAEQIAEGRFKKFVQPLVLLEQPYIREESKTVKQLITETAAKTKENIVVKRFSRFQVGA